MKKAETQGASGHPELLPFTPQEREVSQWLENLPITDIQRCCELVLPTLKVLNKQPMPAIARFEVLEKLRPIVFLLSQKLESQFISSRFPLELSKYALARDCIEFHRELAHGYELVSSDRHFADQTSFAETQRATTLHRALQSYALVALREALIYQSGTSDFWGPVYELFASAERYQIHELGIDDKETQVKSSIYQIFKTILLFALCEPNHYQQHDILRIYNFFVRFGYYAVIGSTHTHNQQTASFYLNIDLDEPPKHLLENDINVANECYRFLFALPIGQMVGEKFNLNDGSNAMQHDPDLPDAGVIESILSRFDSPQKRKFRRFGGNSEHKVIFGLEYLISALLEDSKGSGVDAITPESDVEGADRSDNTATDIWNTDTDKKPFSIGDIIEVYKASDSSASGYRLIYSETSGSKIKVGDLMGFYENPSKIDIGLICWLDYSRDGALSFGIKMLSPQVELAKIVAANAPDTEILAENRVDVNALLLPSLPAMEKPLSVVTEPIKYRVGDRVMLKTKNEEKHFCLERLLDSSSAMAHFMLSELTD